MNAKKVCAPSNGAFSKEIKNNEGRVKRLQMRIVKAQKQRKHNKVKVLQWILTHSYSAKALAVHKLTLSEEKTLITHLKDGFDFLGQNTRKYKNKILTKPAKKNVQSFLDGIRKIILDKPTLKQEQLIGILNPKIRGWTNYHRHIVSKATFSHVDFQIYKALWRWCRRRHSKKGKWWISTTYFHKIGTRNWVFAAKNQKGELKRLVIAADTKIIRHTKIRQRANPYDAEWQAYFEEREGEKMFEGMSGRKVLKKMWSKQNRKCTLCGDEINKTSGWKLHITDKNRKEMVHPQCHRWIHTELKNCAG